MTEGIVCVHNEPAVSEHAVKYLRKSLLPRIIRFLALKKFGSHFQKYPIHKVINIFKMIVKGLTVYAAILDNILYRYLIERLLRKKLYQRRCKRPFCDLRHSITPPRC